MPNRDVTLDFTETSPFVRLFSNPTRVKIADVLLRRPNSALTASEIVDLAGISTSSFSRNKDVFLEMGFMSAHDQSGPTVYRVNTDSETVQKFGEAHTQLLAEAEAIFEEVGRQELSVEDIIRAQSTDNEDDQDRRDESERVAQIVGATA